MTALLLERAVAVVLLAAVAWPTFGPCTSPLFWRAFPFASLLLTGVVAAYAAGGAVLVVAAPVWALRCVVVCALAVLFAVRWHAAVARGRSLRWPPGSLWPLSLGPWFGREFFYEQHRRLGSPFKASHFLRPMVCFVGLADGLEFFRQHEASLSSPPLPFGRFIPGGFLRHMTPERHVATKEVFRKALVREVFEPLEPFVHAAIRTELARMVEESSRSDGHGVPPRRHLQRVVFVIWARVFFGIEPDTAEFQRLKALYEIIDVRNPARVSDRKVRAALAEVSALLRKQLAGECGAGSGAPRSFLEAIAKTRPDSVEDATVIGNLVYMMHTTWADVSGLLTWLFRMLTEHAEWAERLRSMRPAIGTEGPGKLSLATRVVMETLRLEQSEYLFRVANRRIEHDGFVIPRGWLVRLCVRESHQDPAVFEHPQSFDPDRFLSRTFARREYSPFGAGLRHTCLGEGLTMSVGRVFTEELTAGFEWRTVADGPYEFSSWRHWRPSSRWRVLVTQIARP